MGIYSNVDVYPGEADLLFDCEQQFCETCTFDCNEDHDYIINTILTDEKGYYSVNTDAWFLNDVFKPCLTMYTTEAPKFTNNLKELGFNTILVGHRYKHYLVHVFIMKNGDVVDPKNIVPVFRKLKVIK